MSKDLNQCNFIGRLGRDPEAKALPSGDPVVNFSIACGDDYKDKQGNKVEQTNWVNCVAFGKLAGIIAEYVKKGSRIYISGKQVTRKWQDQSGSDRYTTEINVHDMQMLDSKPSGAQNSNHAPQHQQAQSYQQQQATPHQGQHMGTRTDGRKDDGFPDFDSDIPF